MKSKSPLLALLCLPLGGCMTVAILDCALQPKPDDAPAAKHREYPFVLRYEQDGRKVEVADAMVCDYVDTKSYGPDCSRSERWDERRASGAQERQLLVLRIDGRERILQPVPFCSELVSAKDPQSLVNPPYLEAPLRENATMFYAKGEATPALLEKHGIKNLRFDIRERSAGR